MYFLVKQSIVKNKIVLLSAQSSSSSIVVNLVVLEVILERLFKYSTNSSSVKSVLYSVQVAFTSAVFSIS